VTQWFDRAARERQLVEIFGFRRKIFGALRCLPDGAVHRGPGAN